jgi:hypothetical protein
LVREGELRNVRLLFKFQDGNYDVRLDL